MRHLLKYANGPQGQPSKEPAKIIQMPSDGCQDNRGQANRLALEMRQKVFYPQGILQSLSNTP